MMKAVRSTRSGFIQLMNYRALSTGPFFSAQVSKPFESLPSPPHSSTMGTLEDFQKRFTKYEGNFNKLYNSYYQEFGTLVRDHLFEPQALLFHPDDMLDALRQEGPYPTSGATELWATREYYKLRARSHLNVVGPEWVRLRRTVQKDMFPPASAESYIPLLEEPARLASQIIPRAKDKLDAFTPLVAADLFFSVMLGYNPKMVLLNDPKNNHQVDPNDKKFIEKSIRAVELMVVLQMDHNPNLRINFLTDARFIEYTEVLDWLKERSDYYIHRALSQSRKENEILPYIHRLTARQEIDTQEAVDVLTTFFFGGVDTTHNLLLWILFNLSQYHEKQEILYQEIKNAVDQTNGIFQNEHLRLPYLNACIRESYRLTPVSSLLSLRRFAQPIQVHGYTIPNNIPVQFHSHPIQHDSKYVDQPDKFIPERWLSDEVKKRQGTPQEILDHKLLAEPFGYGARMCIGSRVAKAEIKVFLSRLILDWKMTMEPNPKYSVIFPAMSRASPFPKIEFDPR